MVSQGEWFSSELWMRASDWLGAFATGRAHADEPVKELEWERVALEAAPVVPWKWDLARRHLHWRQPLDQWIGAHEVLSAQHLDRLTDLIDPADRDLVRRTVEGALPGRRAFEFCCRLRNGGRALRVAGSPLFADDGNLEGFAGIVEELNENSRIPRALAHQSQLLGQVHDAVVSTDLDGRIESWNAAAARIYGYGPDEVVGKNIGILYFEQEESYLDQQMTAAVLASGAHEFVGRFRHRSGVPLHAEVRLAVLRDPDGAPVGIVSCSHDVTRRREEEEAFQLQARVLESMGEGVCLTDRSGVILFTNPAYDRMYEAARRSLIGRRLHQMFSGDRETAADEWSLIVAELDRTGKWTGDLEYLRGETERFTATVRVSQLVLSDKPFWIWVQQDVTRRRDETAALEARERATRAMAHAIPVAVLMVNDDLTFCDANAAWFALTGTAREDALDEGWRATIHPEDLPDFDAQFAEASQIQRPFHCEIRLIKPSREPARTLCRAAPRFEGDNLAGYVIAALDVDYAPTTPEAQRRQAAAAMDPTPRNARAAGSLRGPGQT